MYAYHTVRRGFTVPVREYFHKQRDFLLNVNCLLILLSLKLLKCIQTLFLFLVYVCVCKANGVCVCVLGWEGLSVALVVNSCFGGIPFGPQPFLFAWAFGEWFHRTRFSGTRQTPLQMCKGPLESWSSAGICGLFIFWATLGTLLKQ